MKNQATCIKKFLSDVEKLKQRFTSFDVSHRYDTYIEFYKNDVFKFMLQRKDDDANGHYRLRCYVNGHYTPPEIISLKLLKKDIRKIFESLKKHFPKDYL